MRIGSSIAVGLLLILVGWFLLEYDPADFALQTLIAFLLLAGGAAVLVSLIFDHLERRR